MAEEVEPEEVAGAVSEESAGLSEAVEEYTATVKAVADEVAADREKATKAAQEKVTEEAAKVQEKVIRLSTPDDPSSSEEVKSSFDELNNVQEVTSTAEAHAAGTAAETGPNKATLDKIAKQTEKFNKLTSEKVKAVAEEHLPKAEFDKYTEASAAGDAAAEKLAKAIKEGNTAAENSAKEELDKAHEDINDIAEENEKFKDNLEAELGERGRVVKAILKYWKILAALGGLAGLFVFCYFICKELSGCYQYTGTSSDKISCPSHDSTCGCGDATKGVTDPAGITKICGGAAPGTGTYANYPFCCAAASPAHPTCSGNPGDKDSVYYAWKEFTPAGIIAGIPGDIVNLVKGGEDLLGGLLKKILTWVGIALAVLIVGYIIFMIGGALLRKATNKAVS
jgi:hypothetical protein